jgi:hypothetical protein
MGKAERAHPIPLLRAMGTSEKLPWDTWEATNSKIKAVARKFILANCLNPDLVSAQYDEANFIPIQ